MSAAKPKKKKRRQRRATAVVVLLMILVGIGLSITVFFPVTKIRVQGDLSYYTARQIIDAAGFEEGDNLFRFSAKQREEDIWRALPYVETVQIRRSLPGTITIEITEVTGVMCVQYTGGCVIVSHALKILEVTSVPPAGAVVVTGLTPEDPKVGEALVTEMAAEADYLKTLAGVLERYGLTGRVTSIDVSDKLNYSMVYDGRYFVMIGTANNADYKIRMLAEVVQNKLDENATGYLDISTAGKVVYKRGPLPLPSDPVPDIGQEPEEEVVFEEEDMENAQNDDE